MLINDTIILEKIILRLAVKATKLSKIEPRIDVDSLQSDAQANRYQRAFTHRYLLVYFSKYR